MPFNESLHRTSKGSTRGNTPWYAAPLRAVALLGAVIVLPVVFLLLSFATGVNEAVSSFFYDLVFSVFPGAAAGHGTGALARAFAGWHASAPPVVWLAVAVLFGWLTRRVSAARSVVVGLLVLIATIATFRLLFAAMGWELLVDTL
ncbi:MAG TPA: hypothetical protein VFJ96_00640 [Gemmatimonadaceae bacterium]|jgi:hypothetical protein|nr:hypothetical protein [Gemmatimonadaceae bacterium]